MNPERGIVHKNRKLDDLYTRPYNPNTLNRQPAGGNDTPRDTLIRPITKDKFIPCSGMELNAKMSCCSWDTKEGQWEAP